MWPPKVDCLDKTLKVVEQKQTLEVAEQEEALEVVEQEETQEVVEQTLEEAVETLEGEVEWILTNAKMKATPPASQTLSGRTTLHSFQLHKIMHI